MKRTILVLAIGMAFVLGIVGAYRVSYGQASKKPIKIGMIADKTGGLAAYGYSHEKTVRAAIAHINKGGGIAGRPVEPLRGRHGKQAFGGRHEVSQAGRERPG